MDNILHDLKEVPGGCIVFAAEMTILMLCVGAIALIVLALGG